MKSYTDLEQSKKLAKILPLESADMKILPFTEREYRIVPINDIAVCGREDEIYAWSLAALLDILAEQDFIIKTIGNEFNIDIPIRHCKIWFSSLLDAAFEMVVWLKKNGKI